MLVRDECEDDKHGENDGDSVSFLGIKNSLSAVGPILSVPSTLTFTPGTVKDLTTHPSFIYLARHRS